MGEIRTRSAPALALSFLFTGAGFALPFLLFPLPLSASLQRAPEVLNLYCLVAWMGLSHFVFAYRGHAMGARRLSVIPHYLAVLLVSGAALFALRFSIAPSLFHSAAWIYFIAHLLKSELYFSGRSDWRLFLFPLSSFAFFSWAMYAPDAWASQPWLFAGAALCFLALLVRPKAGLFHRFSQPIFLISTFLIGEALIWGTYRPNMTPLFRDGVYTVHVALASFYHYFKSYTHMLARRQGGLAAIVAVNVIVILLGSIAQFRFAHTPLIFLFGVQFFTVWVWLHQWMSDAYNALRSYAPRPSNA